MSSVEARLKEREKARRAAAERRRAERESDRRPEEAAGYFSQQFAAKKAAIEELLCGAEDVPWDQLPPTLTPSQHSAMPSRSFSLTPPSSSPPMTYVPHSRPSHLHSHHSPRAPITLPPPQAQVTKPVSPTKPKYHARRPHTQVQKTTSAMVLLIDPPFPSEVPGYHKTDV